MGDFLEDGHKTVTVNGIVCSEGEVVRPDTPSTISEAGTPTRDLCVPPQHMEDFQRHAFSQPFVTAHNRLEPTKSRSSKYRGVCWNKKNKRWQSAINNGGKYVYLGSFVSDVDAAKAFDLAALQIRGKNAKLNFNVEDYPESEWISGAPPHLQEKYRACKPGEGNGVKVHGRRRIMEPFALQGFKVMRTDPRGFDDVMMRERSSFDLAEQEFLRDSFARATGATTVGGGAPRTHEIKIKKECEPYIGDLQGSYPTSTTIFDSYNYRDLGQPQRHAQVPIHSNSTTSCIEVQRQLSQQYVHRLEGSAKSEQFPLSQSKTEIPQHSASIGSDHDKLEDSANMSKGHTPPNAEQKKNEHPPVMDQINPKKRRLNATQPASQLPVPVLHHPSPSLECRSLQVSSVCPESVAGSDIEEAKLIVGSGRNHFGLILRMENKAKWSSLVWDGDTMHDMGIYATENDSQVACVAAVRLVEAILAKDG